MSDSPGSPTFLRHRQLVFTLILAATLALAALHYWQFLQNPRQRWNGITHDRNGHYEFAQQMALALRQGDVWTFFSTLEKSKVWPPVHGLLAAAVLTIGGLDYRLAVLPSLAGWVMTALFGFLLARRISSGCSNLAGVLAAVMVLASPAYRIYGTDIMLESLGAGLTMLAIYLYVVARQEPSVAAWRWLAIALTVLFFEKYNYWLVLVLALVAAEISGWRTEHWLRGRDFVRRLNWPCWLRAQLREPLNYVFGALVLLTFSIFLMNPAPLRLGGRAISLYPPNNLVTVAYAALFVRVIAGWKRNRVFFANLTGPASRTLLAWHCLPVAISFLLPQRLSGFAWFLGPFNRGERARISIAEVTSFYANAINADYHAAAWSAVLAGLLFGLALVTFTRMRPEARAVIALVLIAGVLAIVHPNQKSRFVHSWLATAWVAGGAALATGIQRAGRLRQAFAIATGVAISLSHAPLLASAGHAPERGCRGESTSLLDLPDAYLASLAGARRVAVFSTTPCEQFVRWTCRERYFRQVAIQFPLKDFSLSTAGVQQQLQKWMLTANVDAILFIDVLPGSPDSFANSDHVADAQIGKLISASARFYLLEQWHFPKHGCAITMWVLNEKA